MHDAVAAVGDDHLFGKAEGEAEDAVVDVIDRMIPLLELRLDVLISDDRSGDALRLEGNVKKQPDERILAFCHASVGVDDVGHGLEGEKAYSYRHRQFNEGDLRSRQGVDIGDYEVCVFEKTERSEVPEHRDSEEELFLCRGRFVSVGGAEFAEDEIEKDEPDHQKHVYRLSERVKEKREYRQNDILPILAFSRRTVVEDQEYGEKKIDENKR
jgi:hypothetical protein